MKRYMLLTAALVFVLIPAALNLASADEPKHEITYFKMLPGHVSPGEHPERIQVYEAEVCGVGGSFTTEGAYVIHATYGAEVVCRATVTGKDAKVYWTLSEGDQVVKVLSGPEVRFKPSRYGDFSVAIWATNEPGDGTRYNYASYWRVKME